MNTTQTPEACGREAAASGQTSVKSAADTDRESTEADAATSGQASNGGGPSFSAPVPSVDQLEEWRPIPGLDGMEASSLGRIRSMRRRGTSGGLKKAWIDQRHGYLVVSISRYKQGRKGGPTYVHALVAAAFFGPLPKGMHTRHLDGDKSNNSVTNLRYGTPSENLYDAVRHGTHGMTSRTHCAQGHPFDELNTRVETTRTGTRRRCRKCCADRARRNYRRRRAA